MATYNTKKREDKEFAQFGTLPFRQQHYARAFYYYPFFVSSHLFLVFVFFGLKHNSRASMSSTCTLLV
jgi:hypothetical protein